MHEKLILRNSKCEKAILGKEGAVKRRRMVEIMCWQHSGHLGLQSGHHGPLSGGGDFQQWDSNLPILLTGEKRKVSKEVEPRTALTFAGEAASSPIWPKVTDHHIERTSVTIIVTVDGWRHPHFMWLYCDRLTHLCTGSAFSPLIMPIRLTGSLA